MANASVVEHNPITLDRSRAESSLSWRHVPDVEHERIARNDRGGESSASLPQAVRVPIAECQDGREARYPERGETVK